jgi:hypothetical protein
MAQTVRNKQQAIDRARALWGHYADAWIVGGTRFVSNDPWLNDDGSQPAKGWKHFKGHGKTWDEAFSNAESK